jgi:hypothetical protein
VEKAMSAAHAILPAELRAFANAPAGDDPLLTAMLAAVKAHPGKPLGGEIADEVYHSFYDAFSPTAVNPVTVRLLVPSILDLQEFRVQMYQKGLPESPGSDPTGSLLLLNPDSWKMLDALQQHRALQATTNLISWAGQQAVAHIKSGKDDDAAELVRLLNNEATAVANLASKALGDEALASAFEPLEKLPFSLHAEGIQLVCDPSVKALRDKFSDVNDPGPIASPAQ